MAKQIVLKTQATKKSVSSFINSIEHPERKRDAKELLKIMKDITKEKPKMWGESIVGFGEYEYTRSNGDYGTFMRAGFSPRVGNLTLYVMPGYDSLSQQKLLKDLGPHKLGKACLHVKRLSDISVPALKKIIKEGWKDMAKRYKK